MAKKKAEAKAASGFFDYLEGVNGTKNEAETNPDVAALQARIEAQDRLLAELKAGSSRDLPMVVTTAAPTQTHRTDPASLKVSMDGLPNRDEDPDGFFREYNIRMNAVMEARDAATRAEMMAKVEQERSADRLWNGFKETYPAWGKYTSLVETVSNRVAQDMQNKGVDLPKLLQGNPERFYQEVEGALRQQYGRLIEDTPSGGDEGEEEDEIDTSDPRLVAGVGGAGSGTPSAAAKKGPIHKEPDMFDDLKEMQKRMGIH